MCAVGRPCSYLAELSDIADTLAFQRAEVLGDSAGLQVHDSSEGLIEQGADGGHWEVAGLGLEMVFVLAMSDFMSWILDTHRQGVDHSLETHVDLAAADDLGYIGGVVRLEQSHLETFIFEVASGLGEVQGGVVRGRVPLRNKKNILAKCNYKIEDPRATLGTRGSGIMSAYQLVRKVILSVAMMTDRTS